MPRKASTFTKSEVARAIKGVQSLGLDITGVEIDPAHGKVEVKIGKPAEVTDADEWADAKPM